jgi:hypothetical protein
LRDIVGGLRASDASFDKTVQSRAVFAVEAFEGLRITPAQFVPKFLIARHRCSFSTLLFAREA